MKSNLNIDRLVERARRLNIDIASDCFDTLDEVFVKPEFIKWAMYTRPMGKSQFKGIMNHFITPGAMKAITEFMYERPLINKSGTHLGNLIVEHAISAINNDSDSINNDSSITDVELRQLKNKATDYNVLIGDLLDSINHQVFNCNQLGKKANQFFVDEAILYSMYLQAPEAKYIEPVHLRTYVALNLSVIYDYVGENGLGGSTPEWKDIFEFLYPGQAHNIATTILLESTERFKNYSNSPNVQDVATVWDCLSAYALDVLENSSTDIRRHMMEIYLKRSAKVAKHADVSVSHRIDLMKLPETYANLTSTVMEYQQCFQMVLNGEDIKFPTHRQEPRAHQQTRHDGNNDHRDNREDKRNDNRHGKHQKYGQDNAYSLPGRDSNDSRAPRYNKYFDGHDDDQYYDERDTSNQYDSDYYEESYYTSTPKESIFYDPDYDDGDDYDYGDDD